MTRWSVLYLALAAAAAVFAFGGFAAGPAYYGRILLFVFLVLFVFSIIVGRRGPPSG